MLLVYLTKNKIRNGVLKATTLWMMFENIVPSERSQSQKATYGMIPFIRNVQNRQIGKSTETESRLGGCHGLWGGRKQGVLLMGNRVPSEDEENVLKLDNSDGCTTLNILKSSELHTLRE